MVAEAAEVRIAVVPRWATRPVIDPIVNLTYIDVGMGFTQGKPTRPVNLSATPGVEQVALKWDPPVYEGSSPVTEYIVTAGVHGQYVVDARRRGR